MRGEVPCRHGVMYRFSSYDMEILFAFHNEKAAPVLEIAGFQHTACFNKTNDSNKTDSYPLCHSAIT